MQKHETTKLFWSKYLYKLSIRNTLSPIFRSKNLSYARSVLDDLQRMYETGKPLQRTTWSRVHQVGEQSFLDARVLYQRFKKFDNYLLRIQQNTMNIYSNDKSWLQYTANLVSDKNTLEFWEPDQNFVSLLNENTIIVDKDNGFKYKITLNSSLGNEGFANFAKTNTHLVKVGPTLMDEMENSGYVNNLYFYARDKKVVQLCSLLLNNVRRIDKLVVKGDLDK